MISTYLIFALIHIYNNNIDKGTAMFLFSVFQMK